MADYHESELGELSELVAPRSAEALRNLAKYATIKGYEVINLNEMIANHDEIEKVLKAHDESTK